MKKNRVRRNFGIKYFLFKAVHLCCGYPDKLDTDEYLKAPKTNYNLLAPKIDSLGFDEVSIEDAEATNDLSLLALFKNTKVTRILYLSEYNCCVEVIMGTVAVARTRVETKARLNTMNKIE